MRTLTLAESKRRIELEKKIRAFKKAGEEAVVALRAVREEKLWENDYETFEAYVKGEFGWTRQRAYQLLDADEVRNSLKDVNHGLQINERQARELAKIPKRKRAKVLKVAQVHAEANCKPVTAKGIAKAAESVLHPPASDEPPGLVEWGQPVEVEPEEADYFPSFQSSLKDLVRNIPRGVDLRPYLSALQVEAAFLSNKVNANRNNSAYTS